MQLLALLSIYHQAFLRKNIPGMPSKKFPKFADAEQVEPLEFFSCHRLAIWTTHSDSQRALPDHSSERSSTPSQKHA
jgi:hypothetical protein